MRATALQKQPVPQAVSILHITAARGDSQQAVKTIELLARALDISLERGTLQEREKVKADVFRFHSDDHKFTIYKASGGIRYRHRALYRSGPETKARKAPSDEEVLARAHRDLEHLAKANLIALAQIDREGVHITHQRAQRAERKEGKVRIDKPLTLDARVDFTRKIGNLRFAGNGVRLIYLNDGKLAGLDLVWRAVEEKERRELPVAATRDEALDVFRERVEGYTRLGSTVDLLQAELVYLDPNPRKPLKSLAPTYLFLYRVRTPIEGKEGTFVVGKKRFLALPAIKDETPAGEP